MSRMFSVLLLLAALQAYAQPVKNFSFPTDPSTAGFSAERLSRIDHLLEARLKEQTIPGAVALIIRHGKVVYYKSFGFSDISKKTPLKKDDIFRIASQSKAITALAVMMLWEEGKFLLDDRVSQYIPEYAHQKVLKSFDKTDSSFTTEPANRDVTIRDLLTHSSGIDYAVIGSPEFKAIYAKAGIPSGIGNHMQVLGEKMKLLGSLPLKHQPGERWTYGLNYDLLGYLVEIWSGMPFDQFLAERVFGPLGMKDTYFYLPSDKSARLVALHGLEDGKVFKMSAPPYDALSPDYPKLSGRYFSGGAGMSSTIEDYARFLQLFLNGGSFNGKRLLSRKTVELMLTDQLPTLQNEFGLGFGLETPANDFMSPASVGSFSWGGAFSTDYWADPKEDLIGLLYTNIYNNPIHDLGSKFKVLTYQAITD
ncbi:MAG TPA: serine hydrolase domain-containing protein [Chryseosolibacter sp.]|nr:serine hydrolase domain-containing protein [Chryseosolibacter sp.]